MSRGRTAVFRWVLLAASSGCAYYNSMWSAERLARQAQGLEARGATNEARGLWLQASVKAESVLTRHPRSRWADDALVLRLEGLVRGGDCAAADDYVTRARAAVLDDLLRQRADLAAAECALVRGHPGAVAELTNAALASTDAGVRARAHWLAGRGAWDRGDAATAIELFSRSSLPAAGPARLHALLAGGQVDAGIALFDTLTGRRFREEDWTNLLQDLAANVGPGPTSEALSRALARRHVPLSARLRLLLADGDRLLATGGDALPAAEARYREILAGGLEGGEASLARVRLQRIAVQRAATVTDVAQVRDALQRYVAAYPGSAGGGEAQALAALIGRITDPEPKEAAEFRAAEVARDTLRAPALAGRLFLDYAARRPESLFAPKAIVAALPLLPGQGDSLRALLRERYGQSPYALALQGEPSPLFAAAEDSLAQGLGVARQLETELRGQVLPPVPGMRGPWLDLVFPAPAVGTGDRRARPAGPATPPRPVRQGEKP